jgi:kumamolisin
MANTPPQGYMRLTGSEREPLPNSRPAGPVDPNEPVEVTVYLRAPATSNLANTISEQVQHQGRPLSREEYIASQSAAPDDVAKVVEFARKNDLTIVETDPVSRKVVLAGTAAAMSAAFATELQRYEYPGGTYRGRTGPLHIPNELDQVIVGVFGLDDRPQARPHLQLFDKLAGTSQAHAATISYTPPQIAQLYNFPTSSTLNGSGQGIALIELGGGYRSQDLQTYFQQLNIPLPKVTSVSVDHGHNHPAGTPNSADGEVDLDIEVAGAIAPGAQIVVYFAPNTDRGFLDAITTSAVAPLWAALIALMNQQRKQPVGYLNSTLCQNYQQLSQANALRDVTSGNNGAYSAGPRWDACSGVGTPDGAKLIDALSGA